MQVSPSLQDRQGFLKIHQVWCLFTLPHIELRERESGSKIRCNKPGLVHLPLFSPRFKSWYKEPDDSSWTRWYVQPQSWEIVNQSRDQDASRCVAAPLLSQNQKHTLAEAQAPIDYRLFQLMGHGRALKWNNVSWPHSKHLWILFYHLHPDVNLLSICLDVCGELQCVSIKLFLHSSFYHALHFLSPSANLNHKSAELLSLTDVPAEMLSNRLGL